MNPEINHETLWKCGQWALKFLGEIDWGKTELKKSAFSNHHWPKICQDLFA